jgi:DNA invertase Pin-like site-specific DNA recombinase
MECRHIDGNRLNNNLSNLRWGTKKENHDDQKQHGTAIKGERQGLAKLSEETVREIRKAYKAGQSQNMLAQTFGVHKSTIQWVISRKTWKHVK